MVQAVKAADSALLGGLLVSHGGPSYRLASALTGQIHSEPPMGSVFLLQETLSVEGVDSDEAKTAISSSQVEELRVVAHFIPGSTQPRLVEWKLGLRGGKLFQGGADACHGFYAASEVPPLGQSSKSSMVFINVARRQGEPTLEKKPSGAVVY